VVEEEKIEKETETLYADSAKLISLLEHVVERTAYDPKDTAGVYEFYAKFFWEAVTGERNEGHPRRRIAEQSHGCREVAGLVCIVSDQSDTAPEQIPGHSAQHSGAHQSRTSERDAANRLQRCIVSIGQAPARQFRGILNLSHTRCD
jgi:hypothetical protein